MLSLQPFLDHPYYNNQSCDHMINPSQHMTQQLYNMLFTYHTSNSGNENSTFLSSLPGLSSAGSSVSGLKQQLFQYTKFLALIQGGWACPAQISLLTSIAIAAELKSGIEVMEHWFSLYSVQYRLTMLLLGNLGLRKFSHLRFESASKFTKLMLCGWPPHHPSVPMKK